MYPQYQPIQPIQYQSTMVPVQVPFELMVNISNKMQDRYDKANLAYNTKMDEWLNQSYIDEASRNLFIDEQSKKFENIYNKHKGDLARGYNDVINFLGQASKHPYLNLNKKQQEAFEKFEKYQQAYGPDLIVAKPPDKELFKTDNEGKPLLDANGNIQWKKPSDLEAEVYKAPDYFGNAWKLVGNLRGSGGEGKLDAESYKTLGLIASNDWEAITPKMMKELAYKPIVIEAFKKMSVNWDKDNRPEYMNWGLYEANGDRNSPIVNQKMGEFIESVLWQKKYYKSSKSYMKDPSFEGNSGSESPYDNVNFGFYQNKTGQTVSNMNTSGISDLKNIINPSKGQINNLGIVDVDTNNKMLAAITRASENSIDLNKISTITGVNPSRITIREFMQALPQLVYQNENIIGTMLNLGKDRDFMNELGRNNDVVKIIHNVADVVKTVKTLQTDQRINQRLYEHFGPTTYNQLRQDADGLLKLFEQYNKDISEKITYNPIVVYTDKKDISNINNAIMGQYNEDRTISGNILQKIFTGKTNAGAALPSGASLYKIDTKGNKKLISASDFPEGTLTLQGIAPADEFETSTSKLLDAKGSPSAVYSDSQGNLYFINTPQLTMQYYSTTRIAANKRYTTGQYEGPNGEIDVLGIGFIPYNDTDNSKGEKRKLVSAYNHNTGAFELYGFPVGFDDSDIKREGFNSDYLIGTGSVIDIDKVTKDLINLNIRNSQKKQ